MPYETGCVAFIPIVPLSSTLLCMLFLTSRNGCLELMMSTRSSVWFTGCHLHAIDEHCLFRGCICGGQVEVVVAEMFATISTLHQIQLTSLLHDGE